MPLERLATQVLLRELKLVNYARPTGSWVFLDTEKIRPKCEICTRCATPSNSVYDHRFVKVRDEPLRGVDVRLRIKKRRYWCKTCKKTLY